MSDYEINEKDIDTVLNQLKRVHPENATPEMAIDILEYMQAKAHLLVHENPNATHEDLVEAMYQEITNGKKKS